MTASIAHEIRQPLSAIGASANAGLRWLKRAEPNLEEAQAAFKRVVRDAHRIDEVITSIRATFGGKSREKGPIDLRSVVNEVVALMQDELESHQILVHNAVLEGLPAVLADRLQLQQVLVNLILNAVEAMSLVNGHERRLTIATDFDGQEVAVTVSDTGNGIDPTQLDQIFEPFFTTKFGGMGLGLSICRSIIEGHGGRLWASARSPTGTNLPAETRRA